MERTGKFLFATAMGGLAAFGSGAAFAAEAPAPLNPLDTPPVQLELINSSRLGCGQGLAFWTASNGGSQCAFDSATRGAKMSVSQETSFGKIETYAIVARSTTGAYMASQLLNSSRNRQNVEQNLFMLGFKASALEERLRLTADFGWSERIVDPLRGVDWRVYDASERGTYASVRLDAKLIDQPGFKWSLTGDYKSASEGYSAGSSADLARYFAMAGTRMGLSTTARIGPIGLSAGIDTTKMQYGDFRSMKGGIDLYGIVLRLMARDSIANPVEGSTLLDSRTSSRSARLTVDPELLAMKLFPSASDLPFFVPTSIGVSLKSSETESRYPTYSTAYRRDSFGIDGTWDTPIGETMLSYWQNRRVGLTEGYASRTNEMMQVSHSVRRGNWRFGVDAMLSQGRGVSDDYKNRSWSFGQSIAYSAKDGPELRISLGQDRGSMQSDNAIFVSDDSYSSITASLDLSRYLQKRFERDDLRLTLDYRKAVDRSEYEYSLYDEMVERWIDGDSREGFLVSFGMKL